MVALVGHFSSQKESFQTGWWLLSRNLFKQDGDLSCLVTFQAHW